MSLVFPPTRSARVFGISPGLDFSDVFVDGLMARSAGWRPEDLARVTIFTNTQRAKRRLEVMFGAHGPLLLPQIRVISDLAQDPLLAPSRGPAEPHVAARLRLAQLVRKLLETEAGLAPPVAAFDLAGSLSELMDEMAGAGIDLNAFDTINVDMASHHWQTTLKFLRLLAQVMPEDDLAIGAEARQKRAVAALADHWRHNPPQGPVLVVGSTGSRPATADLMDAVLNFPNGGIVLPGFDTALNARSWTIMKDAKQSAEDHPQYGFAQLSDRLKFDLHAVSDWSDRAETTDRSALISLAMRPAPVTDEWRSDGPDVVQNLGVALAGCDILVAPNERVEATSIATALRQGLNTGQSVALITPDGTLARRVTAQLARWGILPDESAGQPMNLSPEGVFLGLLLTWCETQDPVTLISLLKHPLCAAHGQRGPHLMLARKLDATVLRNCGPRVNWDHLRSWAEDNEEASAWVTWLAQCLEHTAQPDTDMLDTHVARHRQLAEALASGQDATPTAVPSPFWDTEPGRIIDRVMQDLRDATSAAGPISPFDYRAVFSTMIAAEKKRPQGFVPDQRVLIWGQLEARVQSADLIVLGGLNEGIWPSQPPPDPWLNRQMRRNIGLSVPERRIGLAAHDFQLAASAPRVILSRSARQDNQPTVPSRWLVRLENLVRGLGDDAVEVWDQAKARGAAHVARAEAIVAPTATVPAEQRPAPIVPMQARPKRIYVTHAETLVRDPYAYYARQILNLRELPRAGRAADPRDRGNALHLVLEQFVAETLDRLPEDAEATFRRVLDRVIETEVPWPAQGRLWRARLARLASDFIALEKTRRDVARPMQLETKGTIKIPGFARDLELAAKADRIDLAADGSVAIYDYKSRIDTRKQVMAFATQLPLEAKMASMGGFLDGAARAAVRLELIGLSKPGEVHAFDLDDEEIETIWENFLRLVAHYEDPNAAYPSRLRIMKERDQADYDHLARRGEWADGDTFVTISLS